MGFSDLVTQLTHGRNLDTSDEALDGAADFQRGFQEYLPLYNDYTGSSLSLQDDIQRPYDELREIDFRRLSEVAEHSAAIADEFQQTREEINTRAAGVTGWSGDAANAFQAYIQRFQTAAQTTDGELGQIASVTGEAVPAAQAIIAEYVDTIGEIDFSGFDSPEVIRILITIERMAMSVSELVDRLYDGIGDLIGMALPVFSSGGGGLFGSIPVVGQIVDAASDLVGDFIGGVLDFFGGADDLLALASRLARSYLEASFKQPFEDNLDLLNSAVETAKQGITQVFQPVTDAAGAVTLEGFTALGDAPAVGPQPPSSSPTPGTGGPVPPGTGASIPAGTGGPVPGTGTGEPVPAGSQPSGGTGPGSPSTSAVPGAVPAGTSGTAAMPDPVGSPGTAAMPDPVGPPGTAAMPDPVGPPGTATMPEAVGSPGVAAMPEPVSSSGTGAVPGALTAAGVSGTVTMPEAPSAAGGGVPATGPGAEPFQPEPLPVDTGAGDGPGGRPDDLPPGAGWIADPSQLPQGWTVDPQTGELLPPGATGGLDDPRVHSPQGQAVLDGPGLADVATLPSTGDVAGTGHEVMRLGDRTIEFSDVGRPGEAVGFTLSDADGASARYEIRIDDHGNPQVVPATTVPAAEGFASGTVSGGSGSGSAGEVGAVPGSVPGGVPGAIGGEISTGDSGHAAASQSGHMATGWVSFGSDPAVESTGEPGAEPAEGSARLASASTASDSGTLSPPGEAHLASAAEDTRAAQQGGSGAPFMPMGGAAGSGGGDDERHGGIWQVPGADVFEADDEPVAARG